MALRRLLLLDFDGTITQHDTLASLVALAIDATSSCTVAGGQDQTAVAAQQQQQKQKQKQKQRALWDQIVRDYVAAHRVHVAGYSAAAKAEERRTALRQELAFLESAREVERASVTRVSRAGFFAGLDAAALEELGREAVRLAAATATTTTTSSSLSGLENGGGDGGDGDGSSSSSSRADGSLEEKREGAVRLRKGVGEFLEQQGKDGWDLAVVSVNWSREFIRGVVEAGCSRGRGGERIKRVVANGIRFPSGQVEGPEELGGEPLVTAGDKLRAMESLRQRLADEKVVYFGDSTTDLACLMEADLGVVMADDAESKLLNTLRRVGGEVPHVAEAKSDSKLVWARDFDEVLHSGVMARI
ncbi:hypothetical protein MYCTH_2297033 [Thermothelomyces thermophilus ATCC 42464]|uniref:Uncharacterized protein n=1 Tax=Thermothelomyces thermophilus (strain ATCC 42464 / BCRC 31852 / DSM 1799) TaxID=573729 RepID=G2Q448_THET4|nr:uncharacterized protein MYCTH_2297033 [Thermothelomyces thermophilus ATCC 42464]AEO54443.1 hypothetical protein MYCTH_2297033 [Thermothelomyces thermophilus ATCC 42464]